MTDSNEISGRMTYRSRKKLLREVLKRVLEPLEEICPYWEPPLDPEENKGRCSRDGEDCCYPPRTTYRLCLTYYSKLHWRQTSENSLER